MEISIATRTIKTIKESGINGAPGAESVKLSFGGTQVVELDLTAEEPN